MLPSEPRPSAYGLALKQVLGNGQIAPAARQIAHSTSRDEKHIRRYLHKIISGDIQWPAEWWRARIAKAVKGLGLDPDLLPSPESAAKDPMLAAIWRVQASLDELQDSHSERLDALEERLRKIEDG